MPKVDGSNCSYIIVDIDSIVVMRTSFEKYQQKTIFHIIFFIKCTYILYIFLSQQQMGFIGYHMGPIRE